MWIVTRVDVAVKLLNNRLSCLKRIRWHRRRSDRNSPCFVEAPTALDLPRARVNHLVAIIRCFYGAHCEKFGRDNRYGYFECAIRECRDPVIGYVIVLGKLVTIDEGAVTALSGIRFY